MFVCGESALTAWSKVLFDDRKFPEERKPFNTVINNRNCLSVFSDLLKQDFVKPIFKIVVVFLLL